MKLIQWLKSPNVRLPLIYIILSMVIILALAWFKYRTGEVNFRNADATYHTLLTIQAYEETPISVHKFLPIISLGSPDDKFISWGATVPDANGNYYYTSFSWVGYFLPWAFIKLFGLPISISSLYLFNTLLFILATAAWLTFLGIFYKDNKNKALYLPIAMLSVIFMPELMHGMGLAYWHQSILQVTLPIQLTAYYLWHHQNSVHAKRIFYFLTFFNPLTEWTGYVANVGYAALEFFKYRKEDSKKAWKSIFWIMGLSAGAFILFSIHYLMAISASDFIKALWKRFFGRSVGEQPALGVQKLDIFSGYIRSFFAWWLFIGGLCLWNLLKNGKIELKNKSILFILAFFSIENILMQYHAIYYSYDRMKMIFLLSFITCELVGQIAESSNNTKTLCKITFPAAVFCCVINIWNYLGSNEYIWKTNYQESNRKFADYIKSNYANSTLGTDIYVRGYTNLLFHRGIYEKTTMDKITEISKQKDKRYSIMLSFDGNFAWQLYQLKLDNYMLTWGVYRLLKAEVYDSLTHELHTISISEKGDIAKSNK